MCSFTLHFSYLVICLPLIWPFPESDFRLGSQLELYQRIAIEYIGISDVINVLIIDILTFIIN